MAGIEPGTFFTQSNVSSTELQPFLNCTKERNSNYGWGDPMFGFPSPPLQKLPWPRSYRYHCSNICSAKKVDVWSNLGAGQHLPMFPVPQHILKPRLNYASFRNWHGSIPFISIPLWGYSSALSSALLSLYWKSVLFCNIQVRWHSKEPWRRGIRSGGRTAFSSPAEL